MTSKRGKFGKTWSGVPHCKLIVERHSVLKEDAVGEKLAIRTHTLQPVLGGRLDDSGSLLQMIDESVMIETQCHGECDGGMKSSTGSRLLRHDFEFAFIL